LCRLSVTPASTTRRQALQRLTEAAEKAKIELSALPQTSINLPFITATADGPKHIDTTLSRAQFEKLCSDLLERVRRPVEQSLRDAKLDIKDIAEVILVGGSTRIPAVQDVVKSMTGKDPNVTVNPDEVVALGAAVQAGVLAGGWVFCESGWAAVGAGDGFSRGVSLAVFAVSIRTGHTPSPHTKPTHQALAYGCLRSGVSGATFGAGVCCCC
jgi:sugar (pentulose or hexulose) kinase